MQKIDEKLHKRNGCFHLIGIFLAWRIYSENNFLSVAGPGSRHAFYARGLVIGSVSTQLCYCQCRCLPGQRQRPAKQNKRQPLFFSASRFSAKSLIANDGTEHSFSCKYLIADLAK